MGELAVLVLILQPQGDLVQIEIIITLADTVVLAVVVTLTYTVELEQDTPI